MYKQVTAYYFSGTGNAKHTATQIVRLAHESSMAAQQIDISNINPAKKMAPPSASELVIFCYPTHGFNAPPIVLEFLFRFPKSKSNVFFINTRAGMKIANWHTPGLSGLALLLPALVFWLKGYKIKALASVDMPSNWISLHPALRANTIDFIVGRCNKKIAAITNKVFSNKKHFASLFELPVDLLISPISVLYFLFGRFILAKTFLPTTLALVAAVALKLVRLKPLS